jgi:hypothetical protein
MIDDISALVAKHETFLNRGSSALELFYRLMVHLGRCVVTVIALPFIVLGFGIMVVYFQLAGLTRERAESLNQATNGLYRPQSL